MLFLCETDVFILLVNEQPGTGLYRGHLPKCTSRNPAATRYLMKRQLARSFISISHPLKARQNAVGIVHYFLAYHPGLMVGNFHVCYIYRSKRILAVQKSLWFGGIKVKTLSIKVPENVEMDEQEALLIITSKLYEQGKLTLGEAADLSKRAFIEMLGIYGISVFNLEAEELASDLRNA